MATLQAATTTKALSHWEKTPSVEYLPTKQLTRTNQNPREGGLGNRKASKCKLAKLLSEWLFAKGCKQAIACMGHEVTLRKGQGPPTPLGDKTAGQHCFEVNFA